MDIKNLKENFGIVEDEDGVPYAVNFEKNPATQIKDDVDFDCYIVSIDGEIDYENPIKLKARNLTPKLWMNWLND